MIDILMMIYNVLIKDETIREEVGNRIKFNEYPEVEKITSTYIVLDLIDDTLPVEYADGDNMALSYLVQIDVYTKTRIKRDELSYRISRILKEELGLENTANARPEYDKDFKIFRSARRYSGVFYRKEIGDEINGEYKELFR